MTNSDCIVCMDTLHTILYTVLNILLYVVLYNILYAAMYTIVNSELYTVFYNFLLLGYVTNIGRYWAPLILWVLISIFTHNTRCRKYESLCYFVLGTNADTESILYCDFLVIYFSLSLLPIRYQMLRLLRFFQMLKISRLSD